MRQFEIMPRNPEAKGLEFQSSIYELVYGGQAHNLICEVYVTAEAENIKRALNSHDELLAACEALVTAAANERKTHDAWMRADDDSIEACLSLGDEYEDACATTIICENAARAAIAKAKGE